MIIVFYYWFLKKSNLWRCLSSSLKVAGFYSELNVCNLCNNFCLADGISISCIITVIYCIDKGQMALILSKVIVLVFRFNQLY